MNIKKTLKISFLLIIILFLIISSINYLVFNQLKQNNKTKSQINKIISLQEKMNNTLKEVKNSKTISELKDIKIKFNNYEINFEKSKDELLNFKHNNFLHIYEDIHQNTTIKQYITKLLKNEKQIEKAFDKIYTMKNEYISLIYNIKLKYKNEKITRKKLEKEILNTKEIFLIKHFGDMKYYSKEALFQYKDEESLMNWIKEVDILQNQLPSIDFSSYKNIISDLGSDIIRLEQIDRSIEHLRSNIQKLLTENQKLHETIIETIADISNNFFNFIYTLIISLLVVSLVIISFVSYKVNKYVGLSVDEIEKKVKEATKEIENLNNEIQDTQKEVVFTMGAIGEKRSKETGNHVKRVAQYSKILALKYGLSASDAEMLKQASPMHDIGKVAIADAILNKPGRLTDEERNIMQTHAKLGYEMLKSSNRELLKTAAIVAYEHHEKWDGTGYPRGLSKEDIHIYGRITALADVFDALGSDRVYKKAWDDEKIFTLLKDERGKHFDPKLIDIFFDNLNEFLEVRKTFKDI